MRLKIIILFCIALNICSAQYIYFDNANIGNANSESYGDVLVVDNQYIAAGNFNTDSTIEVIRRYDLEGEIIEESVLSPSYPGFYNIGNNSLNIAVTEPSFFVCGGAVRTDLFEGYLIKYSESLDTLWTNYYNLFPQGSSYFSEYLVDEEYLILTAFSEDLSNYPWQGGTAIVKMNLEGEIVWNMPVKSFDPGYMYRNFDIDKLIDGYVIGGVQRYLPEPGESEWTPTITKTNLDGDVEWEFAPAFEGIYQGAAHVLGHSNGGIYSVNIKRYDEWDVFPGSDYFWSKLILREFDPQNGDVISEQEIVINEQGILHGWNTKIIETLDGGIVILGTTCTPDTEFNRYAFLLKFDSLGNEMWYQEYFHDNNNPEIVEQMLWDVEIAPDGGYIMAGNLRYASDSGYRSWLLKVDACGDVEWEGCEFVGVEEYGFASVDLELWPNPVSETLNINIENQNNIESLRVFNSQGKEVIVNLLSSHNAGIIQLDVSSIAKGLYYIQLYDEKMTRTLTSKFVVR